MIADALISVLTGIEERPLVNASGQTLVNAAGKTLVRRFFDAAGQAIAAQLASYEGEPAIFTDEIPPNSQFPAVVIVEKGGAQSGDRGHEGGDVQVDVQVFSNKTRSGKSIRDLAWAIWKLLNRRLLDLSARGYQALPCSADVPANTNDGLGFPGYTIRLRVQILEA